MRRSFLYGVIALAMMMFTGCGYNTIQQNDEAVKAAWGDVEATYQRRNDLVPNLVETVKATRNMRVRPSGRDRGPGKSGQCPGIEGHDRNPQAMAQFQQAQASMGGALSRLLLVAERYPDLKANQNFRDLQNQLEGTENRINVARTRYNKAVQTFNTSIRVFRTTSRTCSCSSFPRRSPSRRKPGPRRHRR
jgi:LemA protein